MVSMIRAGFLGNLALDCTGRPFIYTDDFYLHTASSNFCLTDKLLMKFFAVKSICVKKQKEHYFDRTLQLKIQRTQP